MRQVGILAAAAALALGSRERLGDDNELAQALCAGIVDRFPTAVSPAQVQTNMVLVRDHGLPVSASQLQAHLSDAGIKVGSISSDTLRFVTHRDVDHHDVDRVLAVIADL